MTPLFSNQHRRHQLKVSVESRFAQTLSNTKATHSTYLMTTRLNPVMGQLNNNDFQSQHAFDVLQKLYTFIYSHLINNWIRPNKHQLLPLSFDFLDDPRSKSQRSHITTFNTTPHIHSIILFRKEHLLKLSTITKRSFYRQIPGIESIHLETIKPTEEIKTFNYASKLLKHPIATTTTLYDFNPHPRKTQSLIKATLSSSFSDARSFKSTHAHASVCSIPSSSSDPHNIPAAILETD